MDSTNRDDIKPGLRVKIVFAFAILGVIFLSGCARQGDQKELERPDTEADFPKIASWLAKKDEIISGKHPYDLVMTAWFMPEEAEKMMRLSYVKREDVKPE